MSTLAQRLADSVRLSTDFPTITQDRGPEQLPPASRAEDWFEWEERPGPEPLSTASPIDDLVVRVCYVERMSARIRAMGQKPLPISMDTVPLANRCWPATLWRFDYTSTGFARCCCSRPSHFESGNAAIVMTGTAYYGTGIR
jgi:hypothetical protein